METQHKATQRESYTMQHSGNPTHNATQCEPFTMQQCWNATQNNTVNATQWKPYTGQHSWNPTKCNTAGTPGHLLMFDFLRTARQTQQFPVRFQRILDTSEYP